MQKSRHAREWILGHSHKASHSMDDVKPRATVTMFMTRPATWNRGYESTAFLPCSWKPKDMWKTALLTYSSGRTLFRSAEPLVQSWTSVPWVGALWETCFRHPPESTGPNLVLQRKHPQHQGEKPNEQLNETGRPVLVPRQRENSKRAAQIAPTSRGPWGCTQ